MGTYELDDDQVRRFVESADPGIDDPETAAMIDVLRPQVPIPVPLAIGAVVQTDHPSCAPDPSIFIRWASDVQTPTPWILREELDMMQYRTDEIGRVLRVLSAGVHV